MNLAKEVSHDVRDELLAWYSTAKEADWDNFLAVQQTFKDADMVSGLLVFDIRRNRFRLIVYPVFSRRKLYIKALLTHKEYDRKNWVTKWL